MLGIRNGVADGSVSSPSALNLACAREVAREQSHGPVRSIAEMAIDVAVASCLAELGDDAKAGVAHDQCDY